MSRPEPPPSHRPDSYREAIARWRLDLRTEVKRSSSLPSAMFDACDPMLETRLAETVEAMLGNLPSPTADLAMGEGGEQRLELVGRAELQRLAGQLHGELPTAAALAAGLGEEFFGVLVDAAATADGLPQQRALARLGRDYGVTPGADLEELTRQLQAHVAAACGAPEAPPDEEVVRLGRRIAAALLLHEPALHQDGGEPA